MAERPFAHDKPADGRSSDRRDEDAERGKPRFKTRTIALWALAIAIGHVIYHALRDHVFPDAY